MSYEIDRAPKRPDGTPSGKWWIYRSGVIGGAGRTRIGVADTRMEAETVVSELRSGRISEPDLRSGAIIPSAREDDAPSP